MKTIHMVGAGERGIPIDIVDTLTKIARSKGREDLYRAQMPGLIDQLLTRAQIESVKASSELEGVNVKEPRARNIILDTTKTLRTRNEKELAGYRDALRYAYQHTPDALTVGLACHLHRLLYSHTDGHGGQLKLDDNLIVDTDPETGRRHTRFVPVSAKETPAMLEGSVLAYRQYSAGTGPAEILIAAFVLDFLIIHPFADGNGRVARILTNHLCIQNQIEVVRFVSVEKLVQETSDEYYETLQRSTDGWHDDAHDPWPWIRYFANLVLAAYERFEDTIKSAARVGTKKDRVRVHILEHAAHEFAMDDLRMALPGVGDDTIRLVLRELSSEEHITAESTGRNAKWIRRQEST